MKLNLREYIQADDDISVEEAAQIINERAGKWRNFIGGFSTNNLNWLIYRGMRIIYSPEIAIKYPRSNRRPLTTKNEDHVMADEYFKEKFGIKFRSQSIFTVRDPGIAKFYGDVYSIFPLDDVHFCWSEKVEDFTNELGDFRRKIFPKNSLALVNEISKEQITEFMDSCEYHCDDDSLATTFTKYRDYKKHELMISCDEYLAVRESSLQKVINLLD